MRARRRSGISSSIVADASPSLAIRSCSVATSPVFCRRSTSIARRRATVSSHASGFDGQPFTGQSANAEADASDSASSAAATSCVRDDRNATSLP